MAPLWLLVALACATAYAQDRPKALRVVYLVGGIAHDYDKMPAELARELAADLERTGRTAEVTITTDLAAFDSAALARTDLLLMNTCQQSEVSLERREAFLAAVRAGLPIVALHCTVLVVSGLARVSAGAGCVRARTCPVRSDVCSAHR